MEAQQPVSVTDEDAAGYVDAASRLAPPPTSATARGQVLTIFGAKGGIGKSTIATNVAATIAQDTAWSVLLIDLDTRFGDVVIMMDVAPRSTIADVAQQLGSLDRAMFEQMLVSHSSGVQILGAPHHPSEWSLITADQIRAIVECGARYFDYVILDTPGTFNDIVATAIEVADRLLAVSSLELTSIKNTVHLLDLLEAEGYPSGRLLLTINDVRRVRAVRTTDVAAIAHHDVFWEIPYDEEVPRAVQDGEPVVMARPKSAAAKQFRAMAYKIAGRSIAQRESAPVWRAVGHWLHRGWSSVTAFPRGATGRRRRADAEVAPGRNSAGQAV